MSGSYSGRDPRKFLCVFLSFLIGFSFAINLFGTQDVNADGGMNCWQEYAEDNFFRFGFNCWNYEEGDVIKIVVNFSVAELTGISVSDPSISASYDTDGFITIQLAPENNVGYSVTLYGTGMDKARIIDYDW